ncbi:MAG: NHLP family bacteriocin export ABC transporter peptidase/permease/ATPase subunit [Bacteroidetes bacterium]|nr:NHLP family bacteriocin export ABC transporter peptidase/permease/ATPase subunit [Bacteroidota bacterium]
MSLNPLPFLQTTFEKYRGINRVKTPAFLQMEMLECGAAALGIILSYYGRHESLEKLRVDCGVSRNGSNAANVAQAARKYGLEVKAFRMEPERLKSIAFPAILFWRFGHFLVLEGFGKNKVYLNDPASGPKVVDDKTFDENFTGVVLTMQPGPEFKKSGQKAKFMPLLKTWLKGRKNDLLFLFLAGVGLVFPGLLIPIFSKIFVDQVFIREASSWFIPLIAGLAFSAILRLLFTWVQQSSMMRFEAGLSIGFSSRFFWRLLHLPVSFHIQRPPGDLAMRLYSNSDVAQQLSGQLGNTLLSLFTIVIYTAMMAFYSIPLTLIGITLSLLNFVALKYIYRKRVDMNQQMLQENGKIFGLASAGLRMIESIKANASESEFFTRWSGYQTKLLNLQQKLGLLTQSLQIAPLFLGLLTSALVLVAGSVYIIAGTMSVGTFVAFQALLASFIQPIVSLVNLGGTLQDVEGAMRRIADVYQYPFDAVEKISANALKIKTKTDGYVDMKEIVFGYSLLDKPLIQNFSLHLNPGSRVAIVGQSGSGKSTVAALVSGLYQPWSGEILFDGKKPDEIPPLLFHQSVSLVDQSIFLFGGTIRENLTMWDPSVPEKQIHQAAMDACIYEDIASRPGGFDSEVEENGRNFSGGQRQRIEIARALAYNPSVVILDEATSALDAKTEHLIDLNLRRRGCTCLIIAHRLSTIRDCDEIIVLKKGEIVQRGTHEELMKEEGLYKDLIQE